MELTINGYAIPYPLPLTILTLYLLLYPLYHLTTTYLRLSHLPGPFVARFTNLWMIRTSYSGRLTDIFAETDRRYGPLVRVGPNQILTSDIEFIRRTGAVRGEYDRDVWYNAFKFQPKAANLFNLCGKEEHDVRKSQVSAAYRVVGGEVDAIEGNVDEQVRAVVELLRSKYVAKRGVDGQGGEEGLGAGQRESHDGEGDGHGDATRSKQARADVEKALPAQQTAPFLDFAKLSAYFTLDVATRAAFGAEFGHLKTDDDATGFLKNLHASWPLISLVNESYWARMVFYSDWFLRLFGSQVTDQAGVGKCRALVADVVDKRFRKHETGEDVQEEKRDMLNSWIKHGLTQAQCDAESLLALVAGSETSASVLRLTFVSILTNPIAYKRLQATVRETVKGGDVPSPISFVEAKEIPYLKAVVYEGMRMRPGTQGTFPKIVPPPGETVQGVFIPGGTRVGMNVPAVLRSERLFGPDAEAFRPERWLDPALSPEQLVEMEHATELIFGTGRWMCAGKPIAFMEIYKVLFELFRHFDFSIVNALKPMETTCYNVYVDRDFWVRVTELEDKA